MLSYLHHSYGGVLSFTESETGVMLYPRHLLVLNLNGFRKNNHGVFCAEQKIVRQRVAFLFSSLGGNNIEIFDDQFYFRLNRPGNEVMKFFNKQHHYFDAFCGKLSLQNNRLWSIV